MKSPSTNEATDDRQAIKGELLRFLLTDDFGVGEAQMKLERLVQCANLPRHLEGEAKQAVKDMMKDPDCPVYSKGGGDRKVIQLVPKRLEAAKRLCNEWHPEREPGQSFDATDLSSGPERGTIAFSAPYTHKSRVFEGLQEAGLEFEHQHGSVVDGVDADEMAFVVEGEVNDLSETVAALVDATRGDVTVHNTEGAVDVEAAAATAVAA